MDMQNNKRRNVSTQARVNFSQSETSSLLRGGGGAEFKFWASTVGGGGGELTEKIQQRLFMLCGFVWTIVLLRDT